MGTDVTIHSGILVHYSDVISMLRLSESGVHFVKNSLLQEASYVERLQQIGAWVYVANEKRFRLSENAHAWLRRVSSPAALQSWLMKLCQSIGCEPGRYEQHSVGEYEEDLVKTPVLLASQQIGLKLPEYEIQVFANSRLTGLWDVKLGDVYFSFSEEDCFERKLTPVGKTLQKALGRELSVSEWSTVSY